MGIVTPQFIVDFETSIHATIESAWEDTAADLKWDKIMQLVPSKGRTELIVWLLDAAGIKPEGQGGNRRFEDMAAATHKVTNSNSGSGLQLTTNEISDGVILLGGSIGGGVEMGILDYAGKWARDQGSSAAYWPEQRLWELLRAGETNLGYDGVTFFNTAHPVNPFKPGLGTYSNLRTANLTPAQFATAWAQVRQVKGSHGLVRKLRPRKIIVPSAGKFAALQLFSAKFLGTPQGGTVDNILTAWGIDEIIEVPELEDDRAWYLVCDVPGNVGMSGFIYTDREPYRMNSYTDMTDVELGRADLFEWHYKGRNGIAYGHPFLIHTFNLPVGQAWGVDP